MNRYNRFSPGCCCGPVIGFDDVFPWPGAVSCAPDYGVILSLKSNVSRITQCTAVFAGLGYNACGDAVRFAESDWTAVEDYIRGGGRLFLCAEHSGTEPARDHEHPPLEPWRCIDDMDRLNEFLVEIGSTLSYTGGDYVVREAPNCPDLTVPLGEAFCCTGTPGDAAISAGIGDFYTNRFGGVYEGGKDGVTVFTGMAFEWPDETGDPPITQQTIVVAERLNDGILFLSGDGDPFGKCSKNGCEFLNRLLTWKVEDMI